MEDGAEAGIPSLLVVAVAAKQVLAVQDTTVTTIGTMEMALVGAHMEGLMEGVGAVVTRTTAGRTTTRQRHQDKEVIRMRSRQPMSVVRKRWEPAALTQSLAVTAHSLLRVAAAHSLPLAAAAALKLGAAAVPLAAAAHIVLLASAAHMWPLRA
jgi:hypothetical protein